MPPKAKAAPSKAAAAAEEEEDEAGDDDDAGAPATGLGKLFDLNLSGARAFPCGLQLPARSDLSIGVFPAVAF